MRKLKFKVWNKNKKRWEDLSQFEVEVFKDGTLRPLDGGENWGNEFEICQYIGKQDRLGIEIYENYIIGIFYQSSLIGKQVVEWVGDYFKPFVGGCGTCCTDFDRVEWDKDYTIEIIGNVFENPELIA